MDVLPEPPSGADAFEKLAALCEPIRRFVGGWNLRAVCICDASVFVTPGGAQPSQTIQALATRLADHLGRGQA